MCTLLWAPWCNVVHPRVWAGPGWDALVSQGSHGWPKCIQCHFGSRLSKESNHLTHPPAPSGLRWPLAVPGGVGGQRSWSTSEREAVIRVLVGSDAQGTGLANSQASVVPWIRASLAGLGMGRSALEALASCCGSGFPSMQGGVGPLLQLEGCDCRSGFEGWWCPSTPPLRCCCTLCPPLEKGYSPGTL